MDKLFDTKKTYITNDGDEYVNMCIPVVDINDIKGCSSIELSRDDNGRLDKVVWRSVAKNLDMIDTVMYANHIFNPFAVKEGDRIYIPLDDDSIYKESSEPSLPDGTKHSKNSQGEKEMSYAERVEYLANKGLGLK